MTRTCKIHSLRVIAQLFGVLIVLVPLAAWAQTRKAQPAAKLSVTPSLLGTGVEKKVAAAKDSRRPKLTTGAAASDAPLFLPGATYRLPGFFANGIAAADFNGDGKTDLAVGSDCSSDACAYGNLTILLGTGGGKFQPTETHRVGGIGATWIAVADIFADGSPDLVVADLCLFNPRTCPSGAVTTLRNRTDGSFEYENSYASGALFALAVAVSDINGDGTLDLVVSNCTNSNSCPSSGVGIIGVLLGNGDGTFQPVVTFPSGGVGAGSLTLVDVNGDGKPDIEVSNACVDPPGCTSGSVAVLLGNGNGTFQTPINYPSGGRGASSAAVADVNGDGHPDLLVTITGSSAVGVLLGNGDGTFQSAVTYGSGAAGPRFVVVSDIDLDGKLDLVVATDLIGVLLGNGDGTFQAAVSYSSLGSGPRKLAVTDVNGDGRPDVLVSNRCLNGHPNCNHGSVAVLLNNTGPHSPTTTTLASDVNPAAVNQFVTYTATVSNESGGPMTGTVTFRLGHGSDRVTAPLTNGRAQGGLAYPGTGPHSITATYSGDTANETSISPTLTEYVGLAPSTTTLTTSASPVFVGQSVTFTANVTWTYGNVPDSETVTFYDGINAIGMGTTASGMATFTTSSLSIKTHTIKATYSGDSTFKPSMGAVTQIVNGYQTTTTLTSNRNPSHFGQAVTFAARVMGTGPSKPTGKVKFLDGTTTIGSATLNGGGVAKLTKSTLGVGTHPITAQYMGDEVSAKSTSSVLNQVVQ